MTLSLVEANSIVKAAFAKAQQLNIIVSVAVCDKEGRLIALDRMDGALAEVDRFAIGKAVFRQALDFRAVKSLGLSITRQLPQRLERACQWFVSVEAYQSFEMAKSKEHAALMGKHATPKRKNALVLGSPVFGGNAAKRPSDSGCRDSRGIHEGPEPEGEWRAACV